MAAAAAAIATLPNIELSSIYPCCSDRKRGLTPIIVRCC
jgi:hypothetical protein